MTKPLRVAVIMAGGSGERFWPVSRAKHPKQLLNLSGGSETLLQEAVSRVLPLFGAENVFIATSRALGEVIAQGDPRVPRANVLEEPDKRNTAGALVWAAASIRARLGADADFTMAVLTADHLIGDVVSFRKAIDAAMQTAERHQCLVTIGVEPQRPDTGYGYIELDNPEVPADAVDGLPVWNVHRFREKPNREAAEEFVASGRFFWNSGMFFWRVSDFLTEFDAANRDYAEAVRFIARSIAAGNTAAADDRFRQLESLSIDYALMERARSVMVLRAPFLWDDIGSWDAVPRVREADAGGNVVSGSPVLVDVRDSVVLNEAGAGRLAVAVVGLEGVVVVTTPDGVLVASRERVQDVRKAVEELKGRGSGQV